MSRRNRRRNVASGRSYSPYSQPPVAAPDVLFSPFEVLESGDRSRLGRPDLWAPRPSTAVYPRARPWTVVYPVSLAKRAVGALSSGSNRSLEQLRELVLPRKVGVCVRRKTRREVLFALRRVGYAGSSPGSRSRFTGKYYRRTGDSYYSCR